MPQNRNSLSSRARPGLTRQKPPAAMTWPQAAPVITIAAVLDLVRMFFEMFWFFGPALAALACTFGVNDYLGTSIAGFAGKVVAAGCTAAAGTLGFFGVGPIESFGLVMSDAMGLAAFLILGMVILVTNPRLFKVSATSPLWFVGAFGVAEIPFIGTLPAFSLVLWRLYGTQIKKEGAALRAYKQSQAAGELQNRQQQAAALMQARSAEIAQTQEQEAANDALYAASAAEEEAREQENEAAYAEAANDAQYGAPDPHDEIPDRLDKAA